MIRKDATLTTDHLFELTIDIDAELCYNGG
jgi:hypothetical protein